MSSIYNLEPPTKGKVVIKTSYGDIDIELWPKEAPKACRNFVQLCMEGFYDNCAFFRVIKGFFVQTGDPSGTGFGGESIYDEPFKDEFHQRLRFSHRGLVAMANAATNDNRSQFFITLDKTEELNRKHTIFGKVTGDTIFNVLRIGELETDQEDRPLEAPRIKSIVILSNPFDDIVPRVVPQREELKREKSAKVSKMRQAKDFKLLSFGSDAEADEEEVNVVTKDMKIKSSHDVLNDPRLSKETLSVKEPKEKDNILPNMEKGEKRKHDQQTPVTNENESQDSDIKEMEKQEYDMIDVDQLDDEAYDRLMKDRVGKSFEARTPIPTTLTNTVEKPPVKEGHRKVKEINAKENKEQTGYGEAFLKKQQEKYRAGDNKRLKMERAKQTEALLCMFKSKIAEALPEEEREEDAEGNTDASGEQSSEKTKDNQNGGKTQKDNWMTEALVFEDEMAKLSRDPFKDKTEDMYDIVDPRNPLTVRRREESERKMQEAKRAKERDRRKNDRERERDGDRDRDGAHHRSSGRGEGRGGPRYGSDRIDDDRHHDGHRYR
eukprot:Ihof_evm10s68 gene=Ihof_evmTU10s68